VLQFIHEAVDKVFNGDELVNSICVGAAEGEAIFEIASFGVNKRLGDTVGDGLEITASKTLPGAFEFFLAACTDAVKKFVAYGPSGEADGAVDDNDVVFFAINEGLFEFIGGVTFVSRDEPCGHLHATCAHLQKFIDILACVYSASRDYGNAFAKLLLEGFYRRDYIGQDFFEGVIGGVNLLFFEAEVTARHRAFDDDGVGHVTEVFGPGPEYEVGGPAGGHYGGEFGMQTTQSIKGQRSGKLEGQAGSEKQDVGLFIDGTLDEVVKIRKGDHYINAEDPVGFGSYGGYLLTQRSFICFFEVGI
jgi:hypothetical protein